MPDEGNPTSFSLTQLEDWVRSGVVKWLGHQDNIAEHIAKSHIICLPSYREGVPKSLLEALSCGRPIVASDVPGCREVCEDGVNGLLVPARDSIALSKAIRKLVVSPELRQMMGQAGRMRAESEFSSEIVCAQTLALYRRLMGL